MQAQATTTNSEVQTLSNVTSLRCVETLLKAGLGCIAYLRGLLPCENFSEVHLSAQLPSTQSAGSFDNQTRPSGMTIMSLKRGFTNEGDRILDYLEKGIFEAIEKRYLRRFIFAIYLDNKDPNNIVEAYTFNFQYYRVPNTDTIVPIMSLGDQLSRMSLDPTGGDPVVDALKLGKLPTLGDVKRSLKLMIKTLVTTITQMEGLPKCRYGNFKLFFNDDTPDGYQPPHFRAGDPDSNRWFLTTHRAAEVPERIKIGNLETGWHGVNMKVVSVSPFLPSSTEDNNATFAGLTTRRPPKLTPVEEARLRFEDAELQRIDALNRNVVWDADTDADEDAPGENISDEGIVLARCNGNVSMVPIGVRGDAGKILPIPVHEDQRQGDVIARYGGQPDQTPTHVGHLIVSPDVGQTQVIPPTQEIDMQSPSPPPSLRRISSLPPSDIPTDSLDSTQQIDTGILPEKLRTSEKPRIGINLESESQILLKHDAREPFGRTAKAAGSTNLMEEDTLVECDCGTMADDSLVFCEGGCNKWRHIWCMGYHGLQDKRLPPQFVCFDCRLRQSPEWDIIHKRTHADMISRFKDLALFRRAIKIFEVHKPTTVMQFRAHIGCAAALVSQLLKRLEDEEFIVTESTISDDISSLRSHAKKKATKNKGKKAQKELHKSKFIFLLSSKKSKAYRDYFHPEPQVEEHLLGLISGVVESHLVHGHTYAPAELRTPEQNWVETSDHDSQTQEPTQNLLTIALARQSEANLKRKAVGDSNETQKRVKVSIGTGVDLCD